jgi:hypothetical protein
MLATKWLGTLFICGYIQRLNEAIKNIRKFIIILSLFHLLTDFQEELVVQKH